MNSSFGAVGNQYFRYYDVRQASGITTGQFIIRFIEKKVNEYLNNVLQTKDHVDYIVASDTDSIYVRFGKLVEKTCQGKSTEQITDFLNKVCEQKLEPYIAKCFDELADYSNAFKNAMVETKAIANKGIWVAKKRYMLNVLDEEGVRLAEPKLKLMGIEPSSLAHLKFVMVKLKRQSRLLCLKNNLICINLLQTLRKSF